MLVVKWTTLQYSFSYSVRRVLGMQWWNFRDHKMRGIARLVEERLASQEELYSMEFVSYFIHSWLPHRVVRCQTLEGQSSCQRLKEKSLNMRLSNHNCVWKTSSPSAKKIFMQCSNYCCSCYIQNIISVKTWISQQESHCFQFLRMKWRLCQ